MQEVMNRTDRFFENEIERRRYMDAEIARMDYESAMKWSREEGRQEGRLEGRLEGRQEERQKIQNTAIVKLLKVGVAAKIVALSFSIPLEEVFAIAKRHGVVPAH